MQEWLPSLLFVALISLWLMAGPIPNSLKKQRKLILAGWVLKVLISIAFHWVYSVYYSDKTTGDTWKFFSDAKNLYECSSQKENGFWGVLMGEDQAESSVKSCFREANYWYNSEEISLVNDTRSIIRINFLLMPLSGGNYLFHLFLFSSIAFLGMCCIFSLLQKKFEHNPILINWLVAFGIPSIAFWTGGILKESLMLPLFALIVQNVMSENLTVKKNVLILLCILVLTQIKFYIGVTAFIALLGLLFYNSIHHLKPLHKIIIGLVTLSFGLTFLQIFVSPKLPEMMAHKQRDFVNLARGGDYWTIPSGDTIYVPYAENAYHILERQYILKKGLVYHSWVHLNIKDTLVSDNLFLKDCLAKLKPSGSAFTIQPIQPTWIGLVKAMPVAFVSALFRPFLNELKNPFAVISFFENYFLIALLLLLLIDFLKEKRTPQSGGIFMLIFCVLLLSLIGMTTPVTGALVRYRLPIIWIMAIVCAMHWNRLEEIIKGIRGRKN
jgi:hypothetical protein